MSYDTIIAGAGPAGLSCGIRLASAGQKVLILEKRKDVSGKVCGDGLSSACVKTLQKLNISRQELLAAGGVPVWYNVSSVFGKLEKSRYRASETHEDCGIGISRDVFDRLLLDRAKAAGCEVSFLETVSRVSGGAGELTVCSVMSGRAGEPASFSAVSIRSGDHENRSGGSRAEAAGGCPEPVTRRCRNFVCAVGAGGSSALGLARPAGLPAGMSARVRGRCKLRPDAFYFKYSWQYGGGYAWIFPAGEDLWNYGVYHPDRQQDLRRLFFDLEQHLKDRYFTSWSYDRQPGGALVGAASETCRYEEQPFYCIGDCAGAADTKSGEGISFAIEAGIGRAESILTGKTVLPCRPQAGKLLFSETTEIRAEDLFCPGHRSQ